MTENNTTPPVPGAGQPGDVPGAQPTQPMPGAQPVQPAQPTQTVPMPGVHAAQTAPVHEAQHAVPAGGVPYASAGHAAVPPAPEAKKNSGAKTFLIAFAGALVACVVAFGVMGAVNAATSAGNGGAVEPGATVSNPQGTNITVNGEDATLPEVVSAKCLPSVAAIDVYARQTSGYGNMYGYGWGGGQQGGELAATSLGSGVVLTEDGYIITNNHVVEGGEAFEVTVEGVTYEADLVGADPSSDVAVLKCQDASGLTPMELGDSDDLVIGEWVMTLGSPFGLEQSVATGIVSATSRSQIMDASADPTGMSSGQSTIYPNMIQTGSPFGLEQSVATGIVSATSRSQIMDASADPTGMSSGQSTIYPNMIQTDAAINPGNSGGAMVDAEGKLIGINTLITSYSGNYSGVGFAIPVNYAVSLANQIIDGKTPTHAQLGVSLSNVTPQMAQRYGLSADEGAYIAAVSPDSGAAAAGLQEGDIVTGFDGKAVESASDLMLDVRGKQPGDTVTLTIDRDGQTQDVQVTLGDDSASQQQQQQQAPRRQQGYSYGEAA